MITVRAGRSRGARRAIANRTFRHWSLLPAVLLFVALTLYPLVNLVRMSVSTIEFAQGARDLDVHAARAISTQLLARRRRCGRRSSTPLVFVVVSVAVEMVLGLALAIARRRPRARQAAGCAPCMILPILVPPVAIGSMWKLMYNYDFGIFNQALVAVGAGAGELARLDQPRAGVGDRRRHLALGAVRLPDPVRRGRGAAGRR